MPTTTQDYHVNSQFKMGNSPSRVSSNGGKQSVVAAPATPRMMGKGSATMHGAAGNHQQYSQDSSQLMPPAEITESSSGSQGKLSASQRQSQKPFHRKSLGDWDFLETVGAGSMGKVKLARHRHTNELCAIKIVSRATKSFMHKQQQQKLPPAGTEEEILERRKKLEKEVSRDKRTIREASLGQILYHPHICRLFEMCTMSNHYYMLFEYVSGGQLLDYIIQHGSLRERHARKFARGIASALQYLHLNNIVHRDLKIENIMISSSGEIKIIDFGLSNVYDPKKQLHTFCGSLYFAAPELLKANPYTGPEVDIWSFGVVLYVLVCGKVPFDDENASILHEKIKKGKVEYPQHLSIDVISLLSKMLVVDPHKRATLVQVVNHQWMQKGYDFPPPSYLPPSVPLTVDQINMDVIKEMHRLELIQNIQETVQWLESLVVSDEYKGLCKRYLENADNSINQDNPTRAYNPLLSIYYLVDEMLKRKRLKMQKRAAQASKSAGSISNATPFATSAGSYTSSVGQPRITTPASSALEGKTHQLPLPIHPVPHPGTKASQTSSSNSQFGTTVVPSFVSPATPAKHKTNILVPPKLTIPEQAHTITPRKVADVVEGEAATQVLSPTPASNDFETTVTVKSSDTNKLVPQVVNSTHANVAGTAHSEKQNLGSLFRRFSQRHRHTTSQGGGQSNYHQDIGPLQQTAQYQNTVSSIGRNTHYNRNRETHVRTVSEYAPTLKCASLGSNTQANDNTGNSRPVYEEAQSPLPALPYNAASLVKEQQKLQDNLQDLDITATHASSNGNTEEALDEDKPLRQLSVPKGRKLHPSARAKSVGHTRRESLKFMRPSVATQVSPQDINDEGFLENVSDAKSDLLFGGSSSSGGLSSVDEELTDKQIIELAAKAPPGSMPSIDYPRSLFLKGFFSVQTTSSKPLPIVRYKIISTLKKLKIEFKEVKGGFICVHRQSYMSNRRNNAQLTVVVTDTTSSGPSNNGNTTIHRRQLSIPSRHGSIRRQQNTQPNIPNTPQAPVIHERSSSVTSHNIGGSSSFNEELSTASLESFHEDDILTTSKAQDMNKKDSGMQQQKERPPLRFEIHIVKVRIVGLAGVHFKKVSGNTWMYKELASHILKELNL